MNIGRLSRRLSLLQALIFPGLAGSLRFALLLMNLIFP